MANLKIATYNLNNLFERVKVLELEGFSAQAKEVLDDVKQLNALLEKTSYAGTTGTKIRNLIIKYFFEKKGTKYAQKGNPYFEIIMVREKLFTVSKDGSGPKIGPKGRADWLGWVEFKKSDTNDAAMINTGRVLNAVRADIVNCVEVDNRLALKRFASVLKKEFKFTYENQMLIDGNDDRGIDVGVLSNFPIVNIISHISDKSGTQTIFSRDCPEYEIKLSKTRSLYLLSNHFKSKGYGAPAASNAKRKLQADTVVQILKKYDLKKDYVVVSGDFNDTPDSAPLKNLIKLANLHDVLDSPKFTGGDRRTYHTGKEQIDYILVSAPLYKLIQDVGIERRGIYKKNLSFPEVTSKANQASDHACVWARFKIKTEFK